MHGRWQGAGTVIDIAANRQMQAWMLIYFSNWWSEGVNNESARRHRRSLSNSIVVF
jgi:hypothetical protein